MIELHNAQFEAAEALFRVTNYGSLAAGTLNGSHLGRVLVDRLPHPQSALVCTLAGMGYYFLAGEPTDAFVEMLPERFEQDFLPAQKAAQDNPEILIFFPGAAWKEPLFDVFREHQPILIHKKRMVLNPAARQMDLYIEDSLPPGMRICAYTQNILEKYPALAEEAAFLYGSMDRFLQDGLGFCILDGDTLASQCSSVFTGAGEVEISIATAPDYRKRGLARICTRAFLKASLERGLNPIWGCWPENTPSINLAASLGFIPDADQPVCLWVDQSEEAVG